MPRARTYVREALDMKVTVSDDFGMAASPRCAALLRNGQSCGRTVAAGSEFCVHHTNLLASVDAEAMKQGRTPEERSPKKALLRVVAEPPLEGEITTPERLVASADPSTV